MASFLSLLGRPALPEKFFNGKDLKPGYISSATPITGLQLQYEREAIPDRRRQTPQGGGYTVKGKPGLYVYKDPATVAEERTLEIFKEQAADAKAYRTETMKIAEQAKSERTAAEKMMEDYRNMLIQEADTKRAAQEQADIALRTSTANLAMSGRTPNLQIAPASQTPQTAGTQPFKRRRLMMQSVSPLSSSLNIGLSNALNI